MVCMIVTIHQPEHMPWIGFCHKASLADVLVLLDVVQYRTNYFQNRNRILGPNGPQWLTVPVLSKGHTSRTIAQMEISNQEPWRQKCWKSIHMCYHKHSFFDEYAERFQELYKQQWDLLAQLNETIIRNLFGLLGIRTRIIRASDLRPKGTGSSLLLDICRHTGATTYLAGQCASNYLDRSIFANAGITILTHSFNHPEYPQRKNAAFVRNLSVIDLLFNTGSTGARYLCGGAKAVLEQV